MTEFPWRRTWPYNTWRQRFFEAFGILTGRFSLHRAWQNGYDVHAGQERLRIDDAPNPFWKNRFDTGSMPQGTEFDSIS